MKHVIALWLASSLSGCVHFPKTEVKALCEATESVYLDRPSVKCGAKIESTLVVLGD